MLKAVLFDMDGVLLDTERLHYQANIRAMKELGQTLSWDYYKQFIGTTLTYMWETIQKDYHLSWSLEELRKLGDSKKKEILQEEGYPFIDGAAEFVGRLKEDGLLLALASSSTPEAISDNLKALGVEECYDQVVSSFEVEHRKPAPDVFLEAARRLGVKPEECIVIEDTFYGLYAGKSAGMTCIGFKNPNSGDQDLSNADYLLEFPGEEEAYFREELDGDFLRKIHAHALGYPWIAGKGNRVYLREMQKSELGSLEKIFGQGRDFSSNWKKDIEFSFDKERLSSYISHVYSFYEYGYYLLCRREDGRILGLCGLSNQGKRVYLGYYLLPEYRGMGYGQEGVKLVMDLAKREELKEIYCRIRRDNEKSRKLAKAVGFQELQQEAEVFFCKL